MIALYILISVVTIGSLVVSWLDDKVSRKRIENFVVRKKKVAVLEDGDGYFIVREVK